jgi:hypothetical protein
MGCAEVDVGFFTFSEGKVHGPVFVGVVDVALAGRAVSCGGVTDLGTVRGRSRWLSSVFRCRCRRTGGLLVRR